MPVARRDPERREVRANAGRSEELAQETFVTAWKALGDLDEPARLKSWLCGIARWL